MTDPIPDTNLDVFSAASDVIVVGSGGAGLTAAAVAAKGGARVLVLERSPQLGGTTAVSGGMVWVPRNPHMDDLGIDDNREDALAYMRACCGTGADHLLEAYVDQAPAMVTFLETHTPVRFCAVPRPDYRPEWPGGRPGGRTMDNLPFDTNAVAELKVRPRRTLVPLTHSELVANRMQRTAVDIDRAAIAQRQQDGIVTMGSALASSLVAGCRDLGVQFQTDTRVSGLIVEDGAVRGVSIEGPDGTYELRCTTGVVIACGGYEWNLQMRQAFLGQPMDLPVSPPWNVGDNVALGSRVGAALGNMTDAWWVPTYTVPGETYDGEVLARHLGGDLSLPGSLLVNRHAQRFVNESVNYNDLSAAFAIRDSNDSTLRNVPCWLIFDSRYKGKYQVAGCAPTAAPPDWWTTASTTDELADRIGLDPTVLAETIERFGTDARAGIDTFYDRGNSAHDRFYGDDASKPNPCLAPLDQPPYYAIEVRPGAFGTKGGLVIDDHARVLDHVQKPIRGLYAAGNASAAIMGRGYPGAGATLGAALTFGYVAGQHIAAIYSELKV
jgi:3-oxosteroid 1-dehydrogenase